MVEENGESDETRSKKRGEEEGKAGITKTSLSPALAACMARFGVPIDKITEILRNWSHLTGEALLRRLMDFVRVPARASAHLLVQFDARGGFALVTDFLSKLTGRVSPSSKAEPGKRPGPR